MRGEQLHCAAFFSWVLILSLLFITVISVTTISTIIAIFYFVSIIKPFFSQPMNFTSFLMVLPILSEGGSEKEVM